MNRKLNEFKKMINGKRVAVMGVGISNRPLIRYIYELGAKITAFDMLEANDPVLSRTRQEFEQDGIYLNWSVGPDYLENLRGFDIVFRTPKMRFDVPQLLAERSRGAVITSEMEVFMELCPARIWSVTGSDGKTTTTTLISMMLEKAGWRVHLGGNIGTPLLDRIDSVRPDDAVVLELSSFQLMSMRKSPDTAVVTNISPNHLDVHTDYQEYIDAKKNIYLYQPFDGDLILNADNYETSVLSSEARGFVHWFSRKNSSAEPGAVLHNGWLCWRENGLIETIMHQDDIVIPGRHNVENYLAAITAVWSYVNPAAIIDVATTFGGVEHRMELVRELDGIRYYNSSIDTSPSRSKAALRALADRSEHAVLIMGGQDKKCDYTGLGRKILQVCDRLILCGSNSDLILENLKQEAEEAGHDLAEMTIINCDTYEEAVSQAQNLAKSGEVVVLTPAGTSFDAFRHFEERGRLFKKLVKDLVSQTVD
jgi:UDP-N-acetylmuramoylalanine--D-glutamate ligase